MSYLDETMRADWLAALKTAQQEAQYAQNAMCSYRNTTRGVPTEPCCAECQKALDTFNARLQRIADFLATA